MSCGVQQPIKLSLPVEGVKVVTSADMRFADEYLWHRAAATGTVGHALALSLIITHIDLVKGHAFFGEKLLGAVAVGAQIGGVNRYVLHVFQPSHVNMEPGGLQDKREG